MLADYLVPALVIAFVAWRIGSSLLVRRRLPALRQEGAQLVDVRSLAEFAAGNVPGSVNIPLDEIPQRAFPTVRVSAIPAACQFPHHGQEPVCERLRHFRPELRVAYRLVKFPAPRLQYRKPTGRDVMANLLEQPGACSM